MKITIIAAVANNGVIGVNGKLPWHIPEDLKRFKELTMGHHVLMGRKTYDSLPNQLKGRKEIVVSGKSAIKLLDKVRVIPSIELAIIYATTNYESELFIIGGAQIYKEAINYADRMIITRVNLNPIGDTFFPEINSDKWMVVDEQKQSQLYSFVEYKRIKNYE